jgi:hypothetical protein
MWSHLRSCISVREIGLAKLFMIAVKISWITGVLFLDIVWFPLHAAQISISANILLLETQSRKTILSVKCSKIEESIRWSFELNGYSVGRKWKSHTNTILRKPRVLLLMPQLRLSGSPKVVLDTFESHSDPIELLIVSVQTRKIMELINSDFLGV